MIASERASEQASKQNLRPSRKCSGIANKLCRISLCRLRAIISFRRNFGLIVIYFSFHIDRQLREINFLAEIDCEEEDMFDVGCGVLLIIRQLTCPLEIMNRASRSEDNFARFWAQKLTETTFALEQALRTERTRQSSCSSVTQYCKSSIANDAECTCVNCLSENDLGPAANLYHLHLQLTRKHLPGKSILFDAIAIDKYENN